MKNLFILCSFRYSAGLFQHIFEFDMEIIDIPVTDFFLRSHKLLTLRNREAPSSV